MDVVQTSDNGYLITGKSAPGINALTINPDKNNNNAFLLKTERNSVVEWNKTYGGASDDTGLSAIDVGSSFLFAGTTGSGLDTRGLLVKTDGGGNRLYPM